MRPEELRRTLAEAALPAIVCAQAGNVNTGAFDPLDEIAAAVHEHGGWLHVDGAFGMWAAAAPELCHHVTGLALADSWTTDAHKYLNVPYDSGLVFVRDAGAHRAAMTLGAAYYVESSGGERDGYNWVPESSRRARGFPIYAALRALGRNGLAALVTRCARLARQMAHILASTLGVSVLNEVVLNQVLVTFAPPAGRDAEAFTRDVVARVQADGTCWVGGTTWQGRAAMRISVSGWSTTEQDIERSAQAIVRAAASAAEL
jgi:glutamate/tyrosine decarboxylase-like PLP-dependent enzyme